MGVHPHKCLKNMEMIRRYTILYNYQLVIIAYGIPMGVVLILPISSVFACLAHARHHRHASLKLWAACRGKRWAARCVRQGSVGVTTASNDLWKIQRKMDQEGWHLGIIHRRDGQFSMPLICHLTSFGSPGDHDGREEETFACSDAATQGRADGQGNQSCLGARWSSWSIVPPASSPSSTITQIVPFYSTLDVYPHP